MSFDDVSVWIFDLDNTVYPPSARLFAQIETRMTDWVARMTGLAPAEADRLRADYWRDHGTTLAGLMAHHDIDPHEYLTHVHDIDFSSLTPDHDLNHAIHALPGQKIVHTNADKAYAQKVLCARGLTAFEAVYGIEETGFHPKPDPRSYDAVLRLHGFQATNAVMFEDDPRNLMVPHSLGMRTVLVGNGRHGPDEILDERTDADHIEYQTHDLTDFLSALALSARDMSE